ncbi:MAG: SpoIIIAH-like family protein [Clostridiales bacterium]|nr:SpoIIIAH-like family protein [Clostridiales bacterium]
MKKIFKKNQIIITALAVMIAAAGYISYSDSKLKTTDTSTKTKTENTAETAVDMDSVLQDIESLDGDITDETVEIAEQMGEEGTETADTAGTETAAETGTESGDTADTSLETPGEAVLTGASTYMAQARIDREQVRSQNKETLLEIINNSELSEEERQGAIASMVSMTDLVEKEAAAELLLEAKGYTDVVVNLTGETADIVVPSTQVDDASRAQIEDIVKRKTGISAENIVITPMGEEK